MSPGCAARLRTASGKAAFVKAVGTSMSEGTADLFRREIVVLGALPVVRYRASLLASYDDGSWVGLILEDVDGRYPDLDDQAEAATAWDTVLAQVRELTPPPLSGVPALAGTVARYLDTWSAHISLDPGRYLPAWAVSRIDELQDRVVRLAGRLPLESLCHWDLRDDNLLVRTDGTVVIIDWGMARLGPTWTDPFSLALHWVDSARFDELMRQIPDPPDPDLITDFLVLFGARLAWRAAQPAQQGLPNLPALMARASRELLVGAGRRLGGYP